MGAGNGARPMSEQVDRSEGGSMALIHGVAKYDVLKNIDESTQVKMDSESVFVLELSDNFVVPALEAYMEAVSEYVAIPGADESVVKDGKKYLVTMGKILQAAKANRGKRIPF